MWKFTKDEIQVLRYLTEHPESVTYDDLRKVIHSQDGKKNKIMKIMNVLLSKELVLKEMKRTRTSIYDLMRTCYFTITEKGREFLKGKNNA